MAMLCFCRKIRDARTGAAVNNTLPFFLNGNCTTCGHPYISHHDDEANLVREINIPTIPLCTNPLESMILVDSALQCPDHCGLRAMYHFSRRGWQERAILIDQASTGPMFIAGANVTHTSAVPAVEHATGGYGSLARNRSNDTVSTAYAPLSSPGTPGYYTPMTQTPAAARSSTAVTTVPAQSASHHQQATAVAAAGTTATIAPIVAVTVPALNIAFHGQQPDTTNIATPAPVQQLPELKDCLVNVIAIYTPDVADRDGKPMSLETAYRVPAGENSRDSIHFKLRARGLAVDLGRVPFLIASKLSYIYLFACSDFNCFAGTLLFNLLRHLPILRFYCDNNIPMRVLVMRNPKNPSISGARSMVITEYFLNTFTWEQAALLNLIPPESRLILNRRPAGSALAINCLSLARWMFT